MIFFDDVRDFDYACSAVAEMHPDMKANAAELIAFAKQHERRPLVLQNLSQQIALYEKKVKTLKRPLAERQHDRRMLIMTVAQMFMQAIKVHRDQQNLSDVAKLQLAKDPHEEVRHLITEGDEEVRVLPPKEVGHGG